MLDNGTNFYSSSEKRAPLSSLKVWQMSISEETELARFFCFLPGPLGKKQPSHAPRGWVHDTIFNF